MRDLISNRAYRRRSLLAAIICACVFAAVAHAQVRLPSVQIPQLPSIQLPLNPGDTLNRATDTLDPQQLRELRRLRTRELLRTHRRELEADPNGAPIVRFEIVAYAPTEISLRIAAEAGFNIVRELSLPGLDTRIVVLQPRTGTATRTALRRLRAADPDGNYDFNHIYVESGAVRTTAIAMATSDAPIAATAALSNIKIGLIDTGIERNHSSLQNATIEEFGCDSKQFPAAHGTAVASLLIGHATDFVGAAPTAALYAADVYCDRPTGGSIDAIAAAFSWLVEQQVPVINVSLVGPPNVLLEKIVATTLARGCIVVAAVGNDGPAAPPLYPASYPGVIGVTGVDAKRRVLLEAARGPQVFLAAPGADMGAAGLKNDYVAVRGTSFAAPIVAGLLAQRISTPNIDLARNAIADLVSAAVDLGARGVDKVYGHGLVGENVRIDANALLAKK